MLPVYLEHYSTTDWRIDKLTAVELLPPNSKSKLPPKHFHLQINPPYLKLEEPKKHFPRKLVWQNILALDYLCKQLCFKLDLLSFVKWKTKSNARTYQSIRDHKSLSHIIQFGYSEGNCILHIVWIVQQFVVIKLSMKDFWKVEKG